MTLTDAFDASSWVGSWPFINNFETDLTLLATQLESTGITGAAISPLAAILGPDPMMANLSLLEQVRDYSGDFRVRVVPILDPSLPGWERDLALLLSEHRQAIAAIRIVPSYHSLGVAGAESTRLATAVAEANLGLCVQVRILDERAHHPLMVVPGVPADAIVNLAKAVPNGRILACGIFRSELPMLASAPNIFVELSSIESGDTLADAIEAMGADRLLLGTHAPVYYPLPAVAKLTSSDQPADVLDQITSGNARAFFNFAP